MKTKTIKQIRRLYKNGMKLVDISRKLNINVMTVRYYKDEETRKRVIQSSFNSFKKKSLEERQEIYKKRLPYITKYQKTKYQTNKKFRKSEVKRSRDYRKKIKSKETKND